MKRLHTIILLSGALATVSGLCIWLGFRLHWYMGQPMQFVPFELKGVSVEYPVHGVPPDDMREILAVFAALPDEERDGDILQVTPHGDKHVVIQTGTINGPLAGGGRFLVFSKTENGWIYDEERSHTFWVSQRMIPTSACTLENARAFSA